VYQAPRPSPTKPLYGGPLASHNVIPVIEPPKLPHHDRNLYQVYNVIAEEEESEVTRWKRIEDERDVVQAMNEMETIWREQIIKGYMNDPVYQMAQDSSNTSRGRKMQHYCICDGLLSATSGGGEDCLYIPNGHGINGETLRELIISEIHTRDTTAQIRTFGMHLNLSTGRKCGRISGTLLGNASYVRPTKNATTYQLVMPKPSLSPLRYFQAMLLILVAFLPN